jgi:hypothetical protein
LLIAASVVLGVMRYSFGVWADVIVNANTLRRRISSIETGIASRMGTGLGIMVSMVYVRIYVSIDVRIYGRFNL